MPNESATGNVPVAQLNMLNQPNTLTQFTQPNS